jgi:hypothetical protein
MNKKEFIKLNIEMSKIIFNNFLFSEIMLPSFILKSILMALCTRTPARGLIALFPHWKTVSLSKFSCLQGAPLVE